MGLLWPLRPFKPTDGMCVTVTHQLKARSQPFLLNLWQLQAEALLENPGSIPCKLGLGVNILSRLQEITHPGMTFMGIH